MKNYNNTLMILITMFGLFINQLSYAKVRTVNTRRDFEQSITRDNIVVAFFYDQNDKGLMRMYDDVSSYKRYDDADIVFLKINAARKELQELTRLYGITTMPAFIFFNKGQRMISCGSNGTLTGNITRDILQAYIDKCYGAQMDTYITKKDARNEQRFAQENESWKLYFYPRDMVVPGYGPEERDLE